MTTIELNKRIRFWTVLFGVMLLLSGLTAFPLETELRILAQSSHRMPQEIANWITRVFYAVRETNFNYPFLSYGTDWLAFAHICISISLYGVYHDPVRNRWIIDWLMICCLLVIPLAFFAGPVREIPWFHQLIDCSFGLFGLVPLIIIRKYIQKLENQTSNIHNQ